MDPKAEVQKVLKDVAASAREFAALGLSYSSKALEFAGAKIKKAEETLKVQAEKLGTDPSSQSSPSSPSSKTDTK